jgi:ABC-type transport system substrate-binding protein
MGRQHLWGIAGLAMLAAGGAAHAQKPGGILKIQHWDTPASMSIHEEATYSVVVPVMGVMGNLVIYDQHIAQNSLKDIVPDLAESWAWSEDGKELTFKLRGGVKWHDGKPFTAADVKCTFDLLTGKGDAKLRVNPRKEWWQNVEHVTADSDLQATFYLQRPQPALLTLLASGYSPIYPCHVSPAQMRSHPIGTGPFKFVEFKPNEYIKVTKNLDYWKPGQPYLDGIEYTIVPNRSTAILGFIAGQFDVTWPYCTIPGYDPDVQKNRTQAREIMQKLGYGPDKKMQLTVSTRNVPTFRDPAVILIDQLKEVYVDAVLETIETANWHAKVTRKDYTIALNATGSGVDDPDQQFFENYACGSLRNYSGYCNPELDKKFVEQSAMTDQEARKKLVWEIDKKLQEDGARPIVFSEIRATCMQPKVKGLTIMVNSIYNGWKMEDVWLDQ